MAVLHPLECYLLEKYSYPECFALTRDAIIDWIDAHEAAYARLENNLPPRHRGKPVWQQGDVVWGSRVLPSIRQDKDFYIRAYIQRVNNDSEAFKAGHAMAYNTKGISEFCDDWMSDEERAAISIKYCRASKLDQLLGLTNSGGWEEGDLTYSGQGCFYSLTDIPLNINRYELDCGVRVERYSDVKEVGIYLPDADYAPARLLYPGVYGDKIEIRQGVEQSEYVNKEGRRKYSWVESRYVETTWTRVRRIENEFLDVPEGGFFPRGTPEELYTWPEREKQFISRINRRPFFAMSGEPAPYAGLWSVADHFNADHVTLKKEERLPEKDGKPVKWILVRRDDGGPLSELIPVEDM